MHGDQRSEPLVWQLLVVFGVLLATVLVLGMLDQPGYEAALSESGPIEVATAAVFFGTFAYVAWAGRGEFLRHYGYLAIIPLAFGVREFDVGAVLYGWGLIESPLPHGQVTLLERLAVVALVLFVVICLVRHHGHTLVFRFRERLGMHMGLLALIVLGGLSYLTDGQPAKAGKWFGAGAGQWLSQLPGMDRLMAVEEAAELGIAVVMALMFAAYFRAGAAMNEAARPA